MRLIPLTAAALLLALAAPAAAALDAEASLPYRLRVVVHCRDHPDFTQHFRAEVKRDLHSSLQSALEGLGTVEVIDVRDVAPQQWEPLWKTLDEKGLAALDAVSEVNGVKTHYVRIEQADGRCEVQARQHDGVAGFTSPVIRTARTDDRNFVARLAGQLVKQDFGAIGTFAPPPPGQDLVRVRLKAGALGGQIERWVRKGDVFAVIQVRQERGRPARAMPDGKPAPGQQVGKRIDGLLLQATEGPKNGAIMCRIFQRYGGEVLPVRGAVLGYRCVKLGTIDAPLRLQLVDASGSPYRGGALQVRVHPERFPERADEGEEAPFRNGVFQSRKSFSGLVCARVSIADRTIARIPIEILGDEVTIRQVKVEPGAEARGRLDQARRDVIGRITEARLTQARCFRDLLGLEKEGKNKDALARAETVRKATDVEEAELRQDIERLGDRARRELPDGQSYTADCEQQMQVLRDRQKELAKHIDDLNDAIRIENDPAIQARRKQVQEQIRQAELNAQQADYDQALAAYEKALTALDDSEAKAAVQKRYDVLKKAWAIRDNEHATARQFIYEKWPGLKDPKEIRDNLPAARKAFEKCRAVGDRLTLNKLQLTAPELVNHLLEEAKAIQDSTEEEDQRRQAALKKVSEDLEQFLREVTEYLKASEKSG
jgi:tetratricopeptide (TPR) repeat protein